MSDDDLIINNEDDETVLQTSHLLVLCQTRPRNQHGDAAGDQRVKERLTCERIPYSKVSRVRPFEGGRRGGKISGGEGICKHISPIITGPGQVPQTNNKAHISSSLPFFSTYLQVLDSTSPF